MGNKYTAPNPVPPPIPSVDRETNKVTITRSEDIGQLDGWVYSEEPDATFDMGPDVSRPNHSERKNSEAEGKGLHEVSGFLPKR